MSKHADPSRMAAWRSFLQAHAAVTNALEEELEAARGLPLAWYDVLVQLSEAPDGSMRMQDLARSVLISKSGLTRLFDRMERAGLVRREPCAEDGRGTVAVMTPEGRRAFRRAAPVHQRGIERHFARHLSEPEARTMRAAFGRIVSATENAS